MFGMKQVKINILTSDLKFWRDRAKENFESLQEERDSHARTKSELTIVQEAYSGRLRELDELSAEVASLKTYTESLEYELEEARLQAENLREEAAEFSQMLELYKALVASLRIVIKVPAKKTRG